MNVDAVGLFVATATALLGSPGPGIAALLAVGKSRGWSAGLRYYVGLQIGLGIVVLICGAGLVSLLAAYPAVTRLMIVSATVYLVYLAYAIATAPLKPERAEIVQGDAHAEIVQAPVTQSRRAQSMTSGTFSPFAGALLGITNPKAYLAITSLLASPLQLMPEENSNIALKIGLCLAVIMTVDIIWLWIGVAVGRAKLSGFAERVMNIAMGLTILVATVVSL